MGAEFQYHVIDKPHASRFDLTKEWDNLISHVLHESGHGSYSGTLKECSGMLVIDRHFSNFNLAYDWLNDNTNKWEEAKCVSYDDRVEQEKVSLTFNDKPANEFRRAHNLACVITDYGKQTFPFVFADQLTDTQTNLLKRDLDKYVAVHEEYEKNKLDFRTLHRECELFYDPEYATFSPENWKELRRLRTLLAKQKPKVDKLHAAAKERDSKYANKIVKKTTINNGKKYVVGGWCSC